MFPRMEGQAPPANSLPEARSSTASRRVSSVTMALLVVLASGGAATQVDGVAIGVPSLTVLTVSVMSASLVWFSGVGSLGGFLLPAGAVFVAAFLRPAWPSLLLFSGHPLFAFVCAGLVLAVVAFGRRPPLEMLLPVFFLLYAGVSYRAQTRVGPDGDEPQYLMVAESLIRDHDLVLDQDFKEKRYEAFFSRPLQPDFRVRGPEGQIYSLHAVGLSLLILPAYWLSGYAGASFFMALLAAFLVRELRRLVMDLSGDLNLAEGTAWLVGLSPPIVHFAGLIFTEIPAALLLCIGLRTAVFGRASRAGKVATLCAAGLPWLNVRYAILSLAIVIALAWRGWREHREPRGSAPAARGLLSQASILAASAAALCLYHFELWGFFDPRRVYGRNREFSLDILPEGLPGLFFDQEFGLLVYAPIFVLSLVGLAQLWKRQRGLAVASVFAMVGVVATASVWPMWRGGFNPPGRFLVPLVSILAAGLSLSLRRGIRPATALLAGWSLWCGVGGAFNIETVHRDRDGVAPFFRTQSGAREWTAALPSFVLSEDRPTRVLAWPWAALLGLTLLKVALRNKGARPSLTARDTLVASAAFIAAAMFADHLSPRVRSPERDATRLPGSPSLLLPAFRVQNATEASWASDLFYEPHRSPAGQLFARAVTLEAGRYEIALTLADGATVTSAPSLVLIHRPSGRTVRAPMTATSAGLRAAFGINECYDYDFLLKDGEPLALARVRLSRRY
jgi:hypothetical protein